MRDKTQGGFHFLTFNLLDRKSSLLFIYIDKFRNAYAKTLQHHPFKLDAMVVLPDHVHIMITLPPHSDNYAVIVASIKSQLSKQINKTETITSSL
ncbi:transposase [Psychrobacter sp. 1044]|uniref:transposase n=1 Tax=unclassified Psychrobacter TaxID=196806 RepID=UPI001918F213|nr:transposase [Psychrobacter sp. 1044]